MTNTITDILPPDEPSPNAALAAPSIWRHTRKEEPDPEDSRAIFKSDLPPDLQFDPVPRRARRDGIDAQRQRTFIAMLAATGSVPVAAKAAGCTKKAFQTLRNAAGAESFAAAWEKAIARGVRTILDVMVDNAVNGMPEYLYQNGQLIAERRRFDSRAQQWIVAHYLPEQFAVHGGLMHHPGSAAYMKRMKQQWREAWRQEMEDEMEAERTGSWRHPARGGGRRDNGRVATAEETYHAIVDRMRVLKMNLDADEAERHVGDPEKQAAYDVLNGPQDWALHAAQKQARELEDADNRRRCSGMPGGADGEDGSSG